MELVVEQAAQSGPGQTFAERLVHLVALLLGEMVPPVANLACNDRTRDMIASSKGGFAHAKLGQRRGGDKTKKRLTLWVV